ncbi:MAG: pentapeptide repeat-containing protein [Candidatus Thiodiazotropha taylori]|nr:pentapeptide repeat-containing protein [Candidatus Thiodiazotropha taylori]
MADGTQDKNWFFDQAKERLTAVNEAIRTTRTFSFALLSIAAYIGVVVWSTTDEQLLRISPVKLPLIGVEVPLTGFYTAVPVLFVLMHFNLLMHLAFTSRKLRVFLDSIEPLDTTLASGLRNDVSNFPLAQWMVGEHDAVLRIILTLLIWIMLVLIPPFLLLWMQIRFLAFQNEVFTWIQAVGVMLDALLIVGFRAWFTHYIQPESRWINGWKQLRENSQSSLIISFRLTVTQPLFRYFIPLIPLGIAWHLAVELSDFILPDHQVVSCEIESLNNKNHLRWLCEQYRLDLQELLLTRNVPSPAITNALRSKDEEQERRQALEEALGLNLKGRSLRGVNLSQSLLPNADLRYANLDGANLSFSKLEGIQLEGAQLKGVNLGFARIEGSNLREAQLQSAILEGAWLTKADLGKSHLEGADLRRAQLEGVNLSSANLKGARLSFARLEGANLTAAMLTDTDFSYAVLKGAVFEHTKIESSNLSRANLEGAYLANSILNEVNLEQANLTEAILWKTKFEGVNFIGGILKNANLKEAVLINADLRGVQLEGANMEKAIVMGANLEKAHLKDVNLMQADIESATLKEAWLEGANLSFANLRWADLTDADLTFTNLTNSMNLETAELAGIDYVFADGLEGTILDLNQVVPCMLPGSSYKD